MTADESKQAFEAQIKKQFPAAGHKVLLAKLPGGSYCESFTHDLWTVWQAAIALKEKTK